VIGLVECLVVVVVVWLLPFKRPRREGLAVVVFADLVKAMVE
jgi:hypothetical protein